MSDGLSIWPELWEEGWRLFPLAGAGDDTRSFRCMAQPGSVRPNMPRASWSFALDWPSSDGDALATVFAFGFVLWLPSNPDASARVLVPAPGVIWGCSQGGFSPVLFSAETETRPAENTQTIESGEYVVALVQRPTSSGVTFALAIGDSEDDAQGRARATLQEEFSPIFERELDRRRRFWSAHSPRGDPRLLHVAVESLFASRMESLNTGRVECFSLKRLERAALYPLVHAWLKLDPAVAEELLLEALSDQAPDGRIPLGLEPGAAELAVTIPWVVQAAEEVARQTPGFADKVAPGLRRYLRWALEHYNPTRSEPPSWQNEDEALIPEAFDAKLATPDLTALLLCEIRSYLRMARQCSSEIADERYWMMEAQRLTDILNTVLWNPHEGRFAARYVDGRFVERLTLASLLPLLVDALSPEQRQRLRRFVAPTSPLVSETGLRAWEPWPDDAQAPPIVPTHQFLAFIALQRAGFAEEEQDLVRRICRGFAENRRFPLPWDEAALVVSACAETTTISTCRATRNWVARLDRHRKGLVSAAAGVFVMLIVGLSLANWLRRTPPRSTLEPLIGLVQLQHQLGQYASAWELYEQLYRMGIRTPQVMLARANILFRQGRWAEAEQLYRQLIAEKKEPVAWFNLAVLRYVQGDLEEAAELFSSFADLFSAVHPQLSERAMTAAMLLRHPDAVDLMQP